MKKSVFAASAAACVVALGASAGNPLNIVRYDVINAARSGFGGWAHTYNGTITDTGSGSANGISFTRADYTGGSGTLNDGSPGTSPGDTQLFANNAFARPVITLYLDGMYTFKDITLFSFDSGNSIPGCIASFDVTIAGQTATFVSTHITTNDEWVQITGSSLDGLADNKVILSNFVHDGRNNGLSELFCIGEVVINGNVVPAPGALALLGLAGFAALRRRRA
ncbi:MAG: PEP-CTERM sorting domain-containing protein [Phycisphaeraceae bacterium]|nr:MAG: PEP-CTERM sorting domain-containing protein [Phycisphaeraceae bacterium]